MKHYLLFPILLILFSSSFANNNPIPYRQINVGENYLIGSAYDHDRPLLLLPHYFNDNANSFRFINQTGLSAYLNISGDNVYAAKNLSLQDISYLQSTCSQEGKTHTWLCQVPIVDNLQHQLSFPFHVYDGLRAKSVIELISNRVEDGEILNTTQPYYWEISAIPSNFKETTNVVNLDQYFTDPIDPSLNSISYQLNASKVSGKDQPACQIIQINGLNNTNCADNLFTIKGHLLQAKGLSTAVYQINIKAEDKGDSQYQTFYLNVNANNPSLSEWSKGAVASHNVLGKLPSIYIYSHQDPSKDMTSWQQDITHYAKDIQNINQLYLSKNPIKTTLFEIISAQYKNDAGYSNNFETNRPNINQWITKLTTPFSEQHVGVTLNYTFSNALKANFITLNPDQQNQLTQIIANPVIDYSGLDGVSMDLEGGFDEPGAVQLYKQLSDKLAYHGKWFSFYYFGDLFHPRVVSSFGPLGVALISTYDVGQYRAPLTGEPIEGTKSYDATGFNPEQAQILYNSFQNDQSCSVMSSTDLAKPVSYCNLTLNDSISENNRRWNVSYHTISTADAMQYFNGKYELIYPLAASATEWQQLELWHPNLSLFTKGSGELMTNPTACMSISNDYLKKNDALLNQPSSKPAVLLSHCLFSNIKINNLPLQEYHRCKANMPYSECILISSLPGSIDSSTPIVRDNAIAYVNANQSIYSKTVLHDVGYSVFALETAFTAPAGAFADGTKINAAVQSPWYIGWMPSGIDPQYNKSISNSIWQGFSQTMKQQHDH